MLSREPWTLTAGPDGAVFDLPCEVVGQVVGHVVRPGDELRWLAHPEGTDDVETRWDATAFALDLQFEDGTWLSRTGAVDQYGTRVDPGAQEAARQLWVDQWNLRRVALDSVAGRRITRVVARLSSGTVHVDGVEVAAATPRPASAVDLVDTRRGTNSSHGFSRGNTAPLVGLPNGGVFGLPMTDASSNRWPYVFHHDHPVTGLRPSLEAFATSHIASPWMGDHGVVQVMPSPTEWPPTDRHERALDFDRAAEVATAHRYAVGFDCGIGAELTSTAFALSLRLTYPTGRGSVVLDHLGTVESFEVRQAGEVVTVDLVLRDEGQPFAYHAHVRVPHAVTPHVALEDGRLTGHVVVAPAPEGACDVVVALSTVGPEQARHNAATVESHEAALAASRDAWAGVHDLVHVEGASDDQHATIRSALYRAFLYPTHLGEVGPDGVHRHGSVAPEALRGSAHQAVREGDPSATHGFWDTYRTVWPLLALLDPSRAGRLAQGFVDQARDYGWTPRWSAPGPADCMTGTSLDVILGDLAVKRVPGIDAAAAHATALRNATTPAPDVRVGRKGLRPGIFRDHVDTATHEGLAWTLDNALNDWGASRLAATRLATEPDLDPGRREDLAAEVAYLAHRSLTHRTVFDTERGFFVGRDADGAWRSDPPFDPDVWGHDYTETNAWGTAFTAPHDGAGLAALHGGEAALGAALDTAFARPERALHETSGWYGLVIHEQAEARDMRMGMVALSNQPAHHIPFMYHFAGRHDDAHRVVRDALSRLFAGADLGQGYPGDEDNGEMGAWYLFATLGLYPLVPASGTYVLTPPTVRRSEIRLPHGRNLVIEADHPERGYIAGLTVDGEPWHDISIPHDVLAAGAHLRFQLAETPQGWAAGSRPPSGSQLSGIPGLLWDATGSARFTPPAAAALADDTGDVGHEGDVVVELAEPADLLLYTVTKASAGPLAWTVEYHCADGTVVTEDRDEQFRWDRQTRPFRVNRSGMPLRCVRVHLTFRSPGIIEQLELLAVTERDPRRAR